MSSTLEAPVGPSWACLDDLPFPWGKVIEQRCYLSLLFPLLAIVWCYELVPKERDLLLRIHRLFQADRLVLRVQQHQDLLFFVLHHFS
jgi:hypothetical protein